MDRVALDERAQLRAQGLVRHQIDRRAEQILRKPEIAEKMRGLGAEPIGGTPQALGSFIAKETAKWKEVVKISGAKLD